MSLVSLASSACRFYTSNTSPEVDSQSPHEALDCCLFDGMSGSSYMRLQPSPLFIGDKNNNAQGGGCCELTGHCHQKNAV
jgi:hypothetical protein